VAHGGTCRTHPGEHNTIRLENIRRAVGNDRLDPNRLKRQFNAGQIPGLIVNDRYHNLLPALHFAAASLILRASLVEKEFYKKESE
jgi:hypothetical protein